MIFFSFAFFVECFAFWRWNVKHKLLILKPRIKEGTISKETCLPIFMFNAFIGQKMQLTNQDLQNEHEAKKVSDWRGFSVYLPFYDQKNIIIITYNNNNNNLNITGAIDNVHQAALLFASKSSK